ncbi:hypothetical protein CLV59_103636 [Chitinophaga dinghuensis]|uniref:Uncharacterized protein n=1 Tax=Chitinophaga dinghuensis TaxID=1539050 RepID=A0A327W669_9BACT|nr:hypothetical protein [Chitinophaga dinghuensis]RAJ83665.1 hypothetical protein CLV59_103636 [Chitinophaga dinghuensis]
MATTITAKDFHVPSEIFLTIAGIISKNDINNSITGIDEDEDIIIVEENAIADYDDDYEDEDDNEDE